MQELNQIFNTIKDIAKEISEVIKYADLGYTTHENATGDTQLKLDVKATRSSRLNLSSLPA